MLGCVEDRLARIGPKPWLVLTGAGLSAASGIPTFRGREGYWTVGSINYQPTQLATRVAFSKIPDTVWSWYLYRRTICHQALPNKAHEILSQMESLLGRRFSLVTQNVDGLHQRAGCDPYYLMEVHGCIDKMRCSLDCCTEVFPIPDEVGWKAKGHSLTDAERNLLRCPHCKGRARPHILWFDECYNDEYFYFTSALRVARSAGVFLTIGSSGTTNLPLQMAHAAVDAGAVLIDINPEDNPFSRLALAHGGCWLKAQATTALPELFAELRLDVDG